MNGFLPVSHQEIEAWERKTVRSLDVLELEAVKQIDSALRRHPEPTEVAETQQRDEVKPPRAWPTRKGEPRG